MESIAIRPNSLAERSDRFFGHEFPRCRVQRCKCGNRPPAQAATQSARSLLVGALSTTRDLAARAVLLKEPEEPDAQDAGVPQA